MVSKAARDHAIETVRNRRVVHFFQAVLGLLGMGMGIGGVYWVATFCLFMCAIISLFLFTVDSLAIREIEDMDVAPRSYADTID